LNLGSKSWSQVPSAVTSAPGSPPVRHWCNRQMAPAFLVCVHHFSFRGPNEDGISVHQAGGWVRHHCSANAVPVSASLIRLTHRRTAVTSTSAALHSVQTFVTASRQLVFRNQQLYHWLFIVSTARILCHFRIDFGLPSIERNWD
jgi:hypothetical protein